MKDNIQEQVVNDPMLFKVYDMKKISDRILECTVKEKYGTGKMIFIEIAEGVFVEYSNYFIDYVDDFGDIEFHEDIISMYQLLDGYVVTQINNEKSMIVKKGDTVNFAGNSQFMDCNGYNKRISSIGIFGYYKSVLKLFEDFTMAEDVVGDYYTQMKEINAVLVYRTDLKFEKLFSELLQAVKANNHFSIKLKGLELMYHGMTNFANFIHVKHKEYDNYYIQRVYKVKNYLELNWNKKLRLEEISKLHKINKTYCKEIFKECFGISPHKYVIKLRLEKSKELLENKELKITEIANKIGFSSASRYSESFKKTYGYLPSQYRRKK